MKKEKDHKGQPRNMADRQRVGLRAQGMTAGNEPQQRPSRQKPKKGARRLLTTPDGRRTHPVTIMLTDREMALIQRHLERKKVKNRARYLRNIWLKEILHQLKLSPPTLFDELREE